MTKSNLLFDRDIQKLRRRRALGGKQGSRDRLFFHTMIGAEITDRLLAINRQFHTAVIIEATGACLADSIARLASIDRIVRAGSLIGEPRFNRPDLVVDEDVLPFADQSVGLVASNLTLQDVNDLPGCLAQIRRCLVPDGLLIAALPGERILVELRQAFSQAESELAGGVSPRVAPAIDIRDAGNLLQRAGFALPVVDTLTYTLRYTSLGDLVGDLRASGLTNSLRQRNRTPLGARFLARAEEIYAQQFADPDGRLRATVEILFLTGWAPDDSQQQPLARGSAQVSLESVLKTMK